MNSPRTHRNRTIILGMGLLAILLLILAAQPSSPVAAQPRATLPPTWTPTSTPTASPTRTPTATPSITPTLDIAQVCETDFFVSSPSDDDKTLPADMALSLAVGQRTLVPGASLSITLSNVFTGWMEQINTVRQTSYFVYSVALSGLPDLGLYTWSVELIGADGDVLCRRADFFFLQPARPTPTPTVTVPATQTPFIIVVTATPTPTPGD